MQQNHAAVPSQADPGYGVAIRFLRGSRCRSCLIGAWCLAPTLTMVAILFPLDRPEEPQTTPWFRNHSHPLTVAGVEFKLPAATMSVKDV